MTAYRLDSMPENSYEDEKIKFFVYITFDKFIKQNASASLQIRILKSSNKS